MNRRNLPNLDPLRIACGRQISGERDATGRTLRGTMGHDRRQVFFLQLNPLVSAVAGLSSPFASTRRTFRTRGCIRRVARGWTRRVAGVGRFALLRIGKLQLEFADCRLSCDHLISQQRDLTFQEGQVGLERRRERRPHLGR